GTADRNRSHWSTSKTPSYTKSVSWQHHQRSSCNILVKLITEFTNNKKSNIKYLDIILFIFMRRI
ncbi:hypothetical protein, partial [Escherichia coli]|uniref:hypothetical protein n=1 Tax=Escherichia coli TaxID=562 RepID=UPI001BD6B038